MSIIEQILEEWAYRVDNGMPNPKNGNHLNELGMILDEMGLGIIKNELIENLLKEEGEDDKYVSIGFGRYKEKGKEDDPDSPTFEKDKNTGRYIQLGTDAKPASDKKTDTKKSDVQPNSAEKQSEPSSNTTDTQPEEPDTSKLYTADPLMKARLDKEKEIQNKVVGDTIPLSKEAKKVVGDFESRAANGLDLLPNDKKELLQSGLEKIKVLYSDDTSDEEKTNAAQWIIDNLKFSTNPSGRKAYLNALGGNRKILSGPQGTNNSEDLVQKLKEYGEIKQFDAKGTATKLTTAAKPDLGKDNEFTPKNAPEIKQFFENNPVTKRVREGLWGVYGVKDENGKIKLPSSKYSKEYLEQSFSNPALTNTIKVAEEEAALGNLDPVVIKVLKDHRDRLSSITEKYDIPSEEAAVAIGESYNEMMIGLNKADADIASAVMKQLAENRLYEEELARGEEVYLPSNGNFPGGDKIKVGSLERVSLVSCKFGKSGRIYGMPANAKAITSLHPDEDKRNNQGQYLGESGYTLVVSDELIKGDNTEESIAKTKNFISEKLNEIGLSELFSEDEKTQISEITTEYREYIDSIKEQIKGVKPAERYWRYFNDALSERENEFKSKLGKIISDSHIESLIGKNNLRNAKNKKGDISPEVLLTSIEIANNIRTSDGYGLEHNKQYYDEDGNPKSRTDVGSANPDDYSITFRMKRTPGRAGGGCQLSYTGDGVRPEINLEDDGLLTKNGETLEV